MTAIRSVAVFCGSKTGLNPLFLQHSIELGALLASNRLTLVYGGGNVGLMGAIADEVMRGGGKVVGVIPKVLVDWERQHNAISQLFVVDDMHIRKKKMYELCDAAIVLPGGFGTLDELFEMLTWNQLSIHDKMIFILNTDGYYEHLGAHIDKMQQEGFLYEAAVQRLRIVEEPATIITELMKLSPVTPLK